MATQFGERLARIEATLEGLSSSTTKKLDELIHRLFGNGQPGIIADLLDEQKDIREHVQKLHDENQARMQEIEQRQEDRHPKLLGVDRTVLAAVAYAVLILLAANGAISLKTVVELIKAIFR